MHRGDGGNVCVHVHMAYREFTPKTRTLNPKLKPETLHAQIPQLQDEAHCGAALGPSCAWRWWAYTCTTHRLYNVGAPSIERIELSRGFLRDLEMIYDGSITGFWAILYNYNSLL